MIRGQSVARNASQERIAPRPVYCITEDVHNDREVAEAACRGNFTHAGVTLHLGTHPDWLGAELPADEEWRIEWSKFYYGLDLGNAYRDTGDHRFLRTWEDLVASWIEQVPVGSDSPDVAARRMSNWTYAWSMFASSPAFPGLREGLEAAALDSISRHARFVRDGLTPEVWRNHRTLELYSLFLIAVAWPEVDKQSSLLRFAVSELHRNLVQGFWPDGVHRENSTHYHLIVLRSLLGARENARRFALELPHDFDALLERACEFALHCHRPDGFIPALSDADSSPYPEVLSLAATLLDRPDFAFVATAGREGTPPNRRYVSFPSGGYFVQRSGWGDRDAYRNERFLIFDCGPLGEGGHGHYDVLSVEVFSHGRSLIVDPGRYTYSEEGANLRRWFKGTRGHNTASVDGRDQTPYRRGRPGKRVAIGRFKGRRSTPGFDVLEGTVESPCYDALHTRRVFFVADEYWIFEDSLKAERTHRYDLRWHLAPEAVGATELSVSGDSTVVTAPGFALVIAGHPDVELEPGLVAHRYGAKVPAPVVNVSVHAADARLITLLVPLPAGLTVPGLKVNELTSAGIAGVEVEGWGTRGLLRDVVAWSPRRERMVLDSFTCTAAAAWLRRERDRACSFRALGASDAISGETGSTLPVGPEGSVLWEADSRELVR